MLEKPASSFVGERPEYGTAMREVAQVVLGCREPGHGLTVEAKDRNAIGQPLLGFRDCLEDRRS